MVLLDRLWDDVVAGPQPDHGLEKVRKLATRSINTKGADGMYVRSMSIPASLGAESPPSTPVTPSTPGSAKKENVWRSVFNPGSNMATRSMGNQVFDKPTHSNSRTVYDWLYSGETRSKHR